MTNFLKCLKNQNPNQNKMMYNKNHISTSQPVKLASYDFSQQNYNNYLKSQQAMFYQEKNNWKQNNMNNNKKYNHPYETEKYFSFNDNNGSTSESTFNDHKLGISPVKNNQYKMKSQEHIPRRINIIFISFRFEFKQPKSFNLLR